MRKSILAGALLVAALWSCQGQQSIDLEDYPAWLEEESHGLTLNKVVAPITYSLKYLPAQYIIAKDEEALPGSRAADSLVEGQKGKWHFLFTIGMTEELQEKGGKDIVYYGIGDYKEYKERFLEMNFHLDDAITLNYKGQQLRPHMAVMENTFGLTPDRKVNLLFTGVPELVAGEQVEIVFDDPFFSTGRTHFVFSSNDMLKAPKAW